MPAHKGLTIRRQLILSAVIAALTLTVGGLIYAGLPARDPRTMGAPRDVVPAPAKMFDRKPSLLIVGDFYATAYPDMVADKLGWSLSTDIEDGTGFVGHAGNPSPARAPFIDRLDHDVATYKTDYVLIDGGRNDLSAPPDEVVAAADRYINDVRAHWPKAKIIVVLPAFAVPTDAANYNAVADGLRRAADEVGASVIDPFAQRWYTDVETKSLLGLDGRHLNYNGDIYYADKIVANLTQMFDHKPTLLVVGDSFAGGVGDPSFPTYPNLVARKEGWNLALDAQGGTGFVHRVDNAVPPGVPFMDRLDRDAAIYHYHVDYVLIDGGRSDLYDPVEPVLAAADEYIKKVHSIWPTAKIVVVLPSFVTRDAAPNYPAVAQGLRGTAERVGAQVIDPVAQRWYRNGDPKKLLWKDGANLNGEGNALYADKIVENLTRMGVTP